MKELSSDVKPLKTTWTMSGRSGRGWSGFVLYDCRTTGWIPRSVWTLKDIPGLWLPDEIYHWIYGFTRCRWEDTPVFRDHPVFAHRTNGRRKHVESQRKPDVWHWNWWPSDRRGDLCGNCGSEWINVQNSLKIDSYDGRVQCHRWETILSANRVLPWETGNFFEQLSEPVIAGGRTVEDITRKAALPCVYEAGDGPADSDRFSW